MVKVIHLYPTGNEMVSAFADRLCELIKESDNPRAEMRAIERCLDEQGLWYGSFSSEPSPGHFVHNIVEENPYMQEALRLITIIFTPQQIETIDELLTYIPSFR